MTILEAFVIGFLGSLHCVGMCGPLVLALPLANKTNSQRLAGALLYNFGRTLTYGILGLIFGIIGEGLRISNLQLWISVIFGIALILSVVLPGLIKLVPFISKIIIKGTAPLKKRMGNLLQQSKIYPLFVFGLLNGLLPCGLVYVAIFSGAISTESILQSGLYMILFGLGTLPVMFLLIYFSDLIKSKVLSKIRNVIPIFIVILGILFILRGMNLGIKFISPKMDKTKTEMSCHY